MTTTLKTSFATFEGNKGNGVVQYLGVKYASVRDRISPPEMVTAYGSGIVDATRFGPRAPAMDGCDFEQKHLIQRSIGVPENSPLMSGTECLNLNITVPDSVNAEPVSGLPVMVFVHGGGFIMGANYWPQYDASRLVKLSVEMGLPIVAVSINYRLGILGNLTSGELRKAGYPGNNSLRDQKCALQWVRKHIGGFGGNPENVTCFGESAGAAAVLMQLHSKEPLFKRCISMSGTPIMLKPLPLVAAEASYAKIMKELGLEDDSVEERIEKLKIVTPDEQVEKTPMTVPLTPYLDGDIIPRVATFANLASTDDTLETSVPGHQWCEGLMIGDCQHDGNVFIFMGLAERKAGIAAALSTSLHANIPPIAAKATLNAYGITPATADDEAMAAIIDLGTDIAYHAPALAYARSFSGRTYHYHFNEPNPWEGPFKGCSTHMLDAAFLFQNFNELLPPGAQVVAKRFAADFLRFANGEQPWQNFERNAGKVKVYGPSNERVSDVVKGNGWGSGRRDTLFKLSEAGKIDLDELSGAWDLFIAGK